MAVLSISKIPELQLALAKYGYKVHLHDACGGQSFTLEKVGSQQNDGVFAKIEQFFAENNMSVTFYGDDKMGFIAK